MDKQRWINKTVSVQGSHREGQERQQSEKLKVKETAATTARKESPIWVILADKVSKACFYIKLN